MTFLDLTVLGLATWQVVELWTHGALFASLRARLEVAAEAHRWAVLLTCPFCMAPWVAWLLSLLYLRAELAYPRAGFLVEIFVIGLAVSRLANLGNDLTYEWCHTPGSGPKEPQRQPNGKSPYTYMDSSGSGQDPLDAP